MKRKRFLSLLLTVVMVFTMIPMMAYGADPWDGSAVEPQGEGTSAEPYQIGTAEELAWFAQQVNSGTSGICAELTDDIVLGAEWTETASGADLDTGTAWTPIGNDSNPFSGTFDGAGHMVSDIYINSSGNYQGLFGYVHGGSITDLTVEHSYISGYRYIGGIAGSVFGNSISDCHIGAGVKIVGIVNGGDYAGWIGGICGYFGSGSVTACTNAGSVSGSPLACQYLGGIVGTLAFGTVSECGNSGSVSGMNEIGGIAGALAANSIVRNCFNTGAVTGNNDIGGIAGSMTTAPGYASTSVVNSFNTGLITGNYRDNSGGIVGSQLSSTISNSFYLDGSADTGIGSGYGPDTTIETTADTLKNGEVAHLLQGDQTDLIWGHTTLAGSELPRLAAFSSEVEKVLRVRFYDDAAEPGTFVLNSTVYTLMGGTAAFPDPVDPTVTWLDSANNTYTVSSTFTADTDLYSSRAGRAPVIVTDSLPDGTVGAPYSVTLTATGQTPITWSIESGNLPGGLSLSGNVISGTPATAGTFTFTLKAHNDAGDDSIAITMSIAATLTIDTAVLPDATVGSPYSQHIEVTYTGSGTLYFDAYGLPGGLSIDPDTGEISGTPAAGSIASSPYDVEVEASDGTLIDMKSYTLTVNGIPSPALVPVTDITGGGGSWVYFGMYDVTDDAVSDLTPIKWRVLDGSNDFDDTDSSNGNALFLLSEYLLASNLQFNAASAGNDWQGSAAQAWCENLYSVNFDTVEQSAIAATVKSDDFTDMYGPEFAASSGILNHDKIFFLSAEEAYTSSYGFTYDNSRIARVGSGNGVSGDWWLRSPDDSEPDYAGYITSDGYVDSYFVDEPRAARPALNLNRSSVLLASTAEGGKSSGATGPGALTAVSTSMTSEWKLTLLDGDRSFDVAETEASAAPGGTIALNYTGAVSAPNEYISAMIVDASDNILYYGRLAQPASASGSVDISVPSGLAEGSYTLKVFSEQYNGDYETDYASTFSDVALTVDNIAPAVTGVTPGGTGAPISGNIVITFSKTMDTTVAGAVYLSGNGGAAYGSALTGGSWSGGDTVFTIGYSGLSYGTEYTVKIEAFKDTAGNTMTDDSSHSFVTASTPGTTLPTVTGVTPNSTGAPISGNIAITFSKTMDTTVAGAVYLSGNGGAAYGSALAGGSWSGGSTIFTIGYSGLSYSKTYTIKISGFEDTAGNAMVTDSDHSFTTKSKSSSGKSSSGSKSSSTTTYYTITATAGEGGSISPSGSASVAYGNDKTYTIAADEGYEIKDVLVDGVSVGAVSAYTFEDVKKAHTIAASFKKTESDNTDTGTVNPFTDVATDDWFYENILFVYKNGLMTGTSPDNFNPGGTMTRAMLVTVLYRMSGDTGSYTNIFTDVGSGTWYENAAAWAAVNKITGGTGNGCFDPAMEVTREQFAVMLYNYARYKGMDVSAGEDTNILSYNDALSISDYAYAALQWACGTGIINGDNNDNLNPQSSVTRAEVAAMLQRFIENVIN